jgi:hypothetical protein
VFCDGDIKSLLLINITEATHMRRFGFISTAVLFLFLAIVAPVSAQQDDREKPPAQPAAHDDQAAPPEEKQVPEAKPAQDEEKRTQQDDKKAQDEEKREPKNDKQAQDEQKQQQKDEKNVQQNDKNSPQAKPGQDAHQAASNGGGRIPDDKFRAHFGQQHHFRMSRPTVVSGQPRFQYGGYWFVIGESWPAGWDYSDDCYIDYVDGEYLLFDSAHPGVSIVVSVVL